VRINKKEYFYKNLTRAKIIFFALFLLSSKSFAQVEPIETITYDISPLGYSEYQDFGPVEFSGGMANFVIFKTQAMGFKDIEKIYSDPKNHLPLKVEREVSMWLHDEQLIEDYNAGENKLTITKFEGGRKTKEYLFTADAPIDNAILLPFSLRKVPNLGIGWSYDIRLPDKFKVEIVALEYVTVPAGTFKAYHFMSTPYKFEIWITDDELRLPVKIKGVGGFSYTLSMMKHILKK